MTRFASLLAIMLVLVAVDAAVAQISVNYVDRETGCQLVPQGEGPMIWGEGFHELGPYSGDLDVEQGEHFLRSVHESTVELAGSVLTVAGSYLCDLSTTDAASIDFLHASANLMISFTTAEAATATLEVTIPAGGEVYFLDMTDPGSDFDLDEVGPGTFSFGAALVPDHEYLFQVFYGTSLVPAGPNPVESASTLSLTVVLDSVDFEDVAWGSIKSLFR